MFTRHWCQPQPCQKRLFGAPLRKWNQPDNVPQCLLFHLKTFVWKDLEWRENVKEVTKYILSNASRLEKATFFRKLLTSKERVAMVEELETVIDQGFKFMPAYIQMILIYLESYVVTFNSYYETFIFI